MLAGKEGLDLQIRLQRIGRTSDGKNRVNLGCTFAPCIGDQPGLRLAPIEPNRFRGLGEQIHHWRTSEEKCTLVAVDSTRRHSPKQKIDLDIVLTWIAIQV